MTAFHVTYCSNYNGVIVGTAANVSDAKLDNCAEIIGEYSYEDCDEDGGYHGDIELLREFCIKVIRDRFGADAIVTFEEDSFST